MLALTGCSSLSYYWQAISGHLEIKSREQPVSELLQQADLDSSLRHKLELAQQARRYASEQLGLPDNQSFTRYADLQRPFVTWNVVATPAFSVEPKQWCFFVAGCFNYRGYFQQGDAQALAQELRQAGFDVAISGAWAYSTLGWFSDPLLNTIMRHDEADVIGTMFHELAHQTVYVDDDSSFNEAFATAVEQEGVRRWYKQNGQLDNYETYMQRKQQRNEIVTMLKDTRTQLRDLFAKELNAEQMQHEKQKLFAEMKKNYHRWREQHSYAGYDHWMEQELNNAHLALIATYMDKVPAFLELLATLNGDLPRFYQEAKRLGELPIAQRQLALESYQHAP